MSRSDRGRATVPAVIAEGFFTRLGFGMVTFALPLYALHLGASLAEVGLIAGAKAMAEPLVKPLMGRVVDRFGARRGYLAAVVFRLAASVLLLAASTPAALLAVRFLQGAASAARDPASITVIARRARLRLGRIFSAAIGAKDVGNVSAGLVAGAVLAATGGSFATLWWLVTALALVPVAIVWWWVTDIPEDRGRAEESRRPATTPAPGRLLADPRLRLIAALGLFAGLTAHMTHALFQVYATEVAGLDPAAIGAIYSASIAVLLVVGPIAGWMADRVGNGVLAGVRGLANATSSFVYLLAPSFGGAMVGRVIDDAGKAAFRPTWGSLVASAARSAGPRGGRVAAGLDTALSIGEALGPLVAALIWDTFGLVAFFTVRAILGVGTEAVLGRRIRGTLRAPVVSASAPSSIRPGPGWLLAENLAVEGLLDEARVSFEPNRVAVIEAPSAEAARALVDVLSGRARPAGGHVWLDGQDVHRHDPASVRAAIAVLDARPPEGNLTVGEALRRQDPKARPEELVRVWTLCGVERAVGTLARNLHRRVGGLSPEAQQRLALAASLVADPAALIIPAGSALGSAAELVAEISAGHSGAVVVVSEQRCWDGPADAVLQLTAGMLVPADGEPEPLSREPSTARNAPL